MSGAHMPDAGGVDVEDRATLNRMKQMNPFGRLGEANDIARVVSFLVGPDGGWISGQTVRANGGLI